MLQQPPHLHTLAQPQMVNMHHKPYGFHGVSQELKVGDAVVWEVLDSDHIRVHIFRAAAYEAGPLLRATLPNGGDGGVPAPGAAAMFPACGSADLVLRCHR